MESVTPPQQAGTIPAVRRKRRQMLLFVFGCLASVAVYIAFVPQPRVAKGVLTSAQSDDGTTSTAGELSARPHLAAQATSVHSNVSTSTVSSTSSSDGSTWPQNTVAIFCESDHLLMQRVGLALFEKFRQLPQFDRVQYVPLDNALPVGEEIPDVLIVIGMEAYTESGLPIAIQHEGLFTARIGREFARNSHYTQTSETPPVVQYQAEIRSEYSARQTGVETSGARYSAVSADLAKHLQKSILGVLEKQHAPMLPNRAAIAEFYPPFQPAPELKALTTLNAVPKLQGPRFMESTNAVWTFAAELSPEELRSLFAKELPEPEWKFHDRQNNDQEFAWSWTRGVEAWDVLRLLPRDFEANREAVQNPARYVVRFTRGMSHTETVTAFRATLERDPSEAVLATFTRQWHNERERVQEYFRQHPPQQVDSIRVLAEWESKSGNSETARELILRGATLDRLVFNGDQRKRFEDLAKKVGIEKLPEQFDPQIIATLGLIDLREQPELTLTVGSGAQPLLWLESSEDQQKIARLKISRQRNGDWQLGHEVSSIGPGSSSRATSGPQTLQLDRPEAQWISHYESQLTVTAKRTDDPAAIELHLTNRK